MLCLRKCAYLGRSGWGNDELPKLAEASYRNSAN